jgi:hypothetical protein
LFARAIAAAIGGGGGVASSSATNCPGCSKRIWTNRAMDNWPTRGTLDRVFPSGAARPFQLRAGHHLLPVLGLLNEAEAAACWLSKSRGA